MNVVALILSWNEKEIVSHTFHRLLEEKIPTVVVDNGSTDGTQNHLDPMDHVLLKENKGPSFARNEGIEKIMEEYAPDAIFLIDGDILYVPGTITAYSKLLEENPDAACVGQCDPIDVLTQGFNGTKGAQFADLTFKDRYETFDWFPMAWTQYGLFRADFLKKHPFVTKGVFGKAGHGYEDDWLYQEMKEAGMKSIAVTAPHYYHAAHSGLVELEKAGLESNTKKRGELFHKRWGDTQHWTVTLRERYTLDDL